MNKPLDPAAQEQLLTFYKLLSDGTRLRLVGLLALRPQTPAELAGALEVREPDIARHLARLQDAGLITEAPEPGAVRYALDLAVLNRWNAALFASVAPAAPPADFDGDAQDLKVLAAFLDGARIRSVPAQQAKVIVVLRWLVERFAADERYPESAVNEIIQRHHPDYATWRRLLVDHGLMQRESGIYWRV